MTDMQKKISIFIIICLALFLASSAFARERDIIRMNTDIDVPQNMVVNDVVAIGGNISVSGRVENNVVAVGGSVTLKAGSYVGGEVVVVGGEIFKDQAATVGEKVTQIYMPRFIPSVVEFLQGKWIVLWATISILALLGFLGIAILFAALIPEHIGAIVKIMERSFMIMFLWGLLWSILIVPITVLLAISIVGIILIPVVILLIAIALIIGYIASAVFVGKKILSSFKKIRLPFINVIVGILILSAIGFVPIIGPVVKIIFLMAGFGAVLLTRFGTTR
jgi:hypothetical protein